MILIGIDPGTATTGFGVVEKRGDRVCFVDCGTFETPPDLDAPARLKMIYEDFNTLLDKYRPDGVATERLFFTNNVTTGIPVGRALGVILLTLAQRGLPWAEYTPTQVKSAVVGVGRAEKKQVQFMVTRLLGLNATPKPDDAADALAIAICHAHSLPLTAAVRRGVRG
ncbi:MAG: crossover junction endodeoxyribonuclease RuvC [Armatimonadetes bacterium]|nr:crossover junction endodeoxyribonuclease RuvC [Armatimonadota bacterium]